MDKRKITLSNENITLNINETNPLYKVLLGCIGDSFTVYLENSNKHDEYKAEEEKKEPVYEKIDRNDIWSIFIKIFPEDKDKNTMVAKLLKNHIYSVIGGAYPDFEDSVNIINFGQTSLEMIGDGLYKNGNAYLKYRK